MPITLDTPAGPVQFQPRDFVAMPRNATSPKINEPILRGLTVHHPGSTIGGYYQGKTTFDQLFTADTARVKRTIAEHCARDADGDGILDNSDVGYNYLIGRSGVVFEGRGWTRNGANGTMTKVMQAAFVPAGTTTSNPYYVSVQIIVGTDPGFTKPTPVQIEAACKLYTYIVHRAGTAAPHVNGHRDVRATDCCGPELYHNYIPVIAAAWPVASPPRPEVIPPTPPTMTGDSMLYIALPKYPGATAASEWWAVFESGAVRRAVNSDGKYAAIKGIPTIDQDSKEHDDFLRSISIKG